MGTTLENRVEDYLKANSGGGKSINLSLAKIADHLGCSVASVHRNVQRLEREGLIHVEKHRARNKPDTITFIGENKEDDFYKYLSQVVEQTTVLLQLTNNLSAKLADRQKEIHALRERLNELENRKIVNTIDLPNNNMTMVIYQN